MNDKDFLELLKKYEYSYKIGQIVRGLVVGYEGNNLLVDINTKACAVCTNYEIIIPKNENIKDLFKIGEEYEFAINSLEDEDGIYYLSHKKVALSKNIEILEEKLKNNEVVKGVIVNKTKGGIIVNVLGVKGFVPSSHLKINNEEIGQEIELKILSLDMSQNNFILSNKKIFDESYENAKREIFDTIELNMVVKGKVVRITDFGAFVDIGGVDGLLPLSQMSWNWIDNPNDILKCDDVINVEIIGIDNEKQRISLSLKSLDENPWEKAIGNIQEKQIVKGKVKRIKPFGAFVEVFPKVEGLLNKAQIQQYCLKYNKDLVCDDEINVIIKKFDAKNQKIVLEIE